MFYEKKGEINLTQEVDEKFVCFFLGDLDPGGSDLIPFFVVFPIVKQLTMIL